MKSLDKKDAPPLATLIVIAVAAHKDWFFSLNPITFTDWGYFLNRSLLTQRLHYLSTWSNGNGVGRVLIDLGQAPTYVLAGLIYKLFGIEYNIGERIIHLWPIAILMPVGAYFLAREFKYNRYAAFVAGIVYSLNVPFLLFEMSLMTILAAFALMPFILIWYKRLVEDPSFKNAIIASIVFFVQVCYEPRISYITAFLVIGYSIFSLVFNRDIKRSFYRTILFVGASFTLLIGACSFWALPLTKLNLVQSNELFSRGLFGSQYLNIRLATALSHPYWTGAAPKIFTVQPIPSYLWLLPILFLAGVIAGRKDKRILFFVLVACLGILLTKQADQPFPNLYLWLYQHFPGFNAFREAGKFYGILALGYSMVIAGLFDILIKLPNKKTVRFGRRLGLVAAAVLVAVVFAPLAKDAIFSLTGGFRSHKIPNDYVLLENFLEKDTTYNRTLWVPTASRWSLFSDIHPAASAVDIFGTNTSTSFPTVSGRSVTYTDVMARLESPVGRNITQLINTKYVIVPIRDTQTEDDFFHNYGDDRQYYINALDQLSYFKKINIGTKNLVIYENVDYKPYVTTLDSINLLPKDQNLTTTYQFTNDIAGQNTLKYAFENSDVTAPAVKIQDVFQQLTPENIKNNVLTVNTTQPNNTTSRLYAVDTKQSVSYTVSGSNVLFNVNTLAPIRINNKDFLPSIPSSLQLSSFHVNPLLSYLFSIGDSAYTLDTSIGKVRNLGVPDGPVNVYLADITNIINNGSFENGLWQEKVNDCNAYDGNAEISMKSTNKFTTEGKEALEFDVLNHTACTVTPPVEVKGGSQYELSFDYKTDVALHAAYILSYDEGQNKSQTVELAQALSWRGINKVITIPNDASHLTLSLIGYPDDQRKVSAATYYDNVKLRAISPVATIPISLKGNYENLLLAGNQSLFQYAGAVQSYKNLVNNPSLESGLWQKQVGDCNAYDQNPVLGMRLTSSQKSDGEKALELTAKSHVACTGPDEVNVNEGTNYLVSFDYQSPNSDIASYYISFDDPVSTSFSEDIPVTDGKWHSFAKQIAAPYGAANMTITVYAKATGTNSANIVNNYDNFGVVEIPQLSGRYYVVSEPIAKFVLPKDVSFIPEGPTKKLINIKDATTGFYLSMSEAYHPQWQLEFNNSKLKGLGGWLPTAHPDTIPATDHFKLDDFLNGWYVDVPKVCGQQHLCKQNSDGSYDMEMVAEFAPQRWFYVGLIISGTTLGGCFIYLAYDYKKRHGKSIYYAIPGATHAGNVGNGLVRYGKASYDKHASATWLHRSNPDAHKKHPKK